MSAFPRYFKGIGEKFSLFSSSSNNINHGLYCILLVRGAGK